MKQIHGGNLRETARHYGVPEKEILDFSSSINPLGTPRPALKAVMEEMERLVHYPEIDALSLREAAAANDRVPVENILAGNGSTEFIYLIPRVLHPRKALLPAPTYSDYERALRLAGAEIVHVPLQREEGFVLDTDRFVRALKQGADLALICNPNNPTGSLIPKGAIQEILSAARFTHTTLVVDEAFMDFVLGESNRFQVTEGENLLVLRSLTKFYAIPGLRAGLLYGSRSLIQRIENCQEPWTLNRLAGAAVTAALADQEYRQEAIALIQKERESLARKLGGVPGIRVFPSSANFLLLETSPPMPAPERLFTALIRSGILVRSCASFPGLGPNFIRVAVRNPDENDLLVQALRKVVRELE